MPTLSPPGPLAQHLNALLHHEPFSSIAYQFVWSIFLLVGLPLALFMLPILTFYRIFRLKPSCTPNDNLAVVITGCDSGFGKEFALSAADAGFTVFAGCLDPKKNLANTNDRLVPIQMDVTSDEQVNRTVQIVNEWISKGNDRVLHALINNAGVGSQGIIDWAELSSFEACINGTLSITMVCTHLFSQLSWSDSLLQGVSSHVETSSHSRHL